MIASLTELFKKPKILGSYVDKELILGWSEEDVDFNDLSFM
jgi:hypothetical protein